MYGRNIDQHRMLEDRLFLKNVFLEPHVVCWQSKSDLSTTRRLNLPHADVWANKGHIALWGTAGSGKSSLCKWMAWEWSQGRLNEAEWQMYADLSGASKSSLCQWMAWEWSLGRLKEVEWLIYVDLSGAIESLLKASDAEEADHEWSLFDLLKAYWREMAVIPENADENEVERMVEAMGEKWILVLDGLDAVRAKSDERVASLLGKMRDASWNDVAKAKIVILAGRPPEWKADSVAGRWAELEIVGFDEKQRREYVANAFADRSRLAGAVTKELETEPLNDLACVPLQLQMICLARRYGSVEEFKGLADLYNKTLDLCLRREVYLKEREAATAEDEKTMVRLLKTLDDLAGEKDGMTVEAMDAQLLSRSGIVYSLVELSEDARRRVRIANVEDSADEAPTWNWYHSSFKEFYQARRAVRLMEELGKGASDWDRAVCFHKGLGNANVLFWRIAMWTAKEAERKKDTGLFRGCFWGWLIGMSMKGFDCRILQCKELEGWKEAALALTHANSDGLDHNMFCDALCKGGQCFDLAGCRNDALKMYEECRVLRLKVLGPEHPDYLMTLHNMAIVYNSNGQLDEALKLFEECRVMRLKVLGPEHPDYLSTLLYDANVNNFKGQHDEALKLFQECREGLKRVLGPEHPLYLNTLSSIAFVYRLKGQLDEALKRYEECRVSQLNVLGSEHPDYLKTLQSIASIYSSKGQYDEALKLLEECRLSRLKVLGPEHPDYLMTLKDLASVCKLDGQHEKVVKFLEESREVHMRMLGPEHPDNVRMLHKLATVYNSKGQYDEALKLYEECRVLQLKVFGPEHLDYLTTLNDMASVYNLKGQHDKALKLLEESREVHMRVLGPEHPDNLRMLHKLATVYNSKGQYDEALKLYKECSVLQLKVLGPDHPNYLATLNDMGGAYAFKGQYDEALELLEDCRLSRLKVLGREHPDYLATLYDMSGLHCVRTDFVSALPLLRECVATGRKVRCCSVEDWENALESVERQLNLQKPKQVSQKIGPNDLCPCKSGKKYKKCCKNKK